MLTVVVTGAGGFVGKRFMEYNKDRFHLRAAFLREQKPADIDLSNVDAIVHLAGKAHEMKKIDDEIYFNVNYELTKQLADKAVKQKTALFIYVSTVKVYGDDTEEVLDESSECIPTDAYGKSKLKAENYLQSINSSDIKIAIVRPPLVYGPEVKGNMIRLLQLAQKKIPLPFGNTGNKRSMVFIDNLIELINTIIFQKAEGIFIPGDNAPISTDEMIGLMRKHMGAKKNLISIPRFIRNTLRRIKPSLYKRLYGSFIIDNSNTNLRLNFTPPYSTEYGVQQMVHWFMNKKEKQ